MKKTIWLSTFILLFVIINPLYGQWVTDDDEDEKDEVIQSGYYGDRGNDNDGIWDDIDNDADNDGTWDDIDNDDVGDTTVTVTVTDVNIATDTKTFSLLVKNTNDPPFVVNPISDISLNEDAASTVIALNGVFADDDIAVAGDSLILSISNDNMSIITTSLVGFTLTLSYLADQNGIANIIVTATDDSSASVADTFTITVNPVNDIPIAMPQSITLNEDTTSSITLTGSDADGDSLYLPILTLPANGTLTGRPDTLIVFNVTDFQAGPAAGNYWMFDQDATPFVQDASSVYAYEGFQWVTQTASNPIAENMNVLTGLTGVTVYIDSLVISSFEHVNVVSGGVWNTLGEAGDRRIYSNGIGEIHVDGVIKLKVENITFMLTTYYPDPIGPGGVDGYADGFGYGVINVNTSDPDWITEFDPNNTGLVEFDFQSFSPTVQGFYGSFDVLSLTITPISDNSITYHPNPNFNGSDDFLFVALDGTAISEPAEVAITVNPVNDSPSVANPLIDIEVNEDAGNTIINLDSLFADIDIETNTDSLVLGVSNNNANLLNTSLDGLLLTLSYNPDQNGSAGIFVSATDDSLATVTDTFSVIVRPINDTPYLSQLLPDVLIDEDDFGAIVIPRLEDYFADVDSMDHLSFTGLPIDTGLDSLNIGNDGGRAFFQRYGLGHISPELLSQKQAVLAVKRSQVKIKNNKSDNSGRQPDKTLRTEFRTNIGMDTYSGLTRESRADTTALIVYPTLNFNGDIQIVITATDDSLAFVGDTLILTVAPINDVPLLSTIPDTTMGEDDTLHVPLIAFDFDNDSLIFAAEADTNALTATINDTLLTLIPEANWNGQSMISVSVSDNDTSVTTQFELSVIAVNDPPSAFELVSPEDSTVFGLTTDNLNEHLVFDWVDAIDVDGDSVLYSLKFTGGLGLLNVENTYESEVRILNDSLLSVLNTHALTVLEGTWTVTGYDLVDSTVATNGPFFLIIDASQVSVNDEPNLPTEFALHQNYPNPFNPTTQLRYDLPEQSIVILTIYDLLGRQITTLINDVKEPGFHTAVWNGTDQFGKEVSAGVYLYQIKAGEYIQTRKMVLLK